MQFAAHVNELRLEECARQAGLASPLFRDVRRHLAICDLCRVRFEEMEEYVAFMHDHPDDAEGRAILKRETTNGTVFLIIEGSDASDWEGRVVGGGFDFALRFARGPEAMTWLENWFDDTIIGPQMTAEADLLHA